jgi:hypothetical protein
VNEFSQTENNEYTQTINHEYTQTNMETEKSIDEEEIPVNE